MYIHVKLTGEAAHTIEEMIRRGHAANKTEAVRMAILHYKYCVMDKQPKRCPFVIKEKELNKIERALD